MIDSLDKSYKIEYICVQYTSKSLHDVGGGGDGLSIDLFSKSSQLIFSTGIVFRREGFILLLSGSFKNLARLRRICLLGVTLLKSIPSNIDAWSDGSNKSWLISNSETLSSNSLDKAHDQVGISKILSFGKLIGKALFKFKIV